jgi:ATP-dependent DNA ligase
MNQKSVIAAIAALGRSEDIQSTMPLIESEVFGYSIRTGNENEDELKVGIPVSCMLARPAVTSAEIPKLLKKFSNEIIAEVKYDGERTQVNLIESHEIKKIHYDKGDLILYSRGKEDQNEKYYFLLKDLQDYFEVRIKYLFSIQVKKNQQLHLRL